MTAEPNGRRGDAIGVHIAGVSHEYVLETGTLPVLEDIDLTVPPGSFTALLGPSGSGKSTILRIVAGLESPSRGRVLAGGVTIEGPDPSRAVVFQEATLFPWRNVWRNVALGPEARGSVRSGRAAQHDPRIVRALERVGLTAFATALPHQLSGGMAQRVALARALIGDPAVLLLDEPLGKLDALTRGVLQRELADLWQSSGFTALLVTHDVDEALILADRILVLSERPGRIVADLAVDIERPRHRTNPNFIALRLKVLGWLGFPD
jgi:ABC-type nitrate/sulfonate/bicarbonate transport system ATPase subunit